MKPYISTYLSLFTAFAFAATASAQTAAPHLEKRGQATQLIVDGKPYIVLAGEMHNSSSSELDYLNPLWAPLKQMNLNTALVAASWELVEPQEGKFDFSLVDGILKGARQNNMHVVLLWFGSWKNGLSHYAPEWVKKDYKRFPRVVLENGKPTETLSAISTESAKADAKAFAALMRHVKETDAQHTVLMIQVENEVGVIGGTRDHSAMADAEFKKQVPAALLESIKKNQADLQPQFKQLWQSAGSKTSGTWAEVFGNGASADEAFMAWNYANYLNTIAAAGKAAYDIPMFVNAWLVQPEDKKPGDYPGGGPQAHVHDIWRAGAPKLDILAPDIYVQDFKGTADMYHHSWNPLFVPESRDGEAGAANAFYIIGKHNAIGYSPFGIDAQRGGITDDPSKTPLAKAYSILSQLTPEIAAAQAAGAINAVSLDRKDSVQYIDMGGYRIKVTPRKNWNGVSQTATGYGMIINSGPDMFTIAGSNIDVTFVPNSPGPKMAGLSYVREGSYVNGVWKNGRLLNGDNIMASYKLADEAAANRTGTAAKLGAEPGILKVKLYRFE